MMARSCCIICGVVLILGWQFQVSHKCHWGGICLMLSCMVIQGKIIQMLASEIKTLAFMESFHRPGGITTSDLQRQICLPSLITLHAAVKPRRGAVSPTAAEEPIEQRREWSVLFAGERGIWVCMCLTGCWWVHLLDCLAGPSLSSMLFRHNSAFY